MWQDISCQPPLMISTAKSFGYMAKYFCTNLPTSLNAFCPQKYHHSWPDSQRIWGSFDLRDMGWPNVCISPLPGARSGKVTERSVSSSHQCFLKFPAALRWQTLATSVTAFETDRKEKTKTRPVILGYWDIGIISQVWAALHAVGNRIMWWEGQSTFCDGKVGGSTSMALAVQGLVDF